MTVYCQLRILLARANVERAKQEKPPLSLRRLAEESGVSLSVLASLHTGHSQRVDYATIDRLLNYFSYYFNVTPNDLFIWERAFAQSVENHAGSGLQTFSRREEPDEQKRITANQSK
jgi:transcriptional regulator with XRE-family HTH domain